MSATITTASGCRVSVERITEEGEAAVLLHVDRADRHACEVLSPAEARAIAAALAPGLLRRVARDVLASVHAGTASDTWCDAIIDRATKEEP